MTAFVVTNRHTLRRTLRLATLLAAMLSLLLTAITPFVQRADATLPGSTFDGTDGVLDPGTTTIPDDCNVQKEWSPINGAPQQLGVIQKDVPPTLGLVAINNARDLCSVNLGSEISGGNFFLYLAWERFTNQGTWAGMFEFHQQELVCTTGDATCNPFNPRTDGDFIIVFDFQGNTDEVYLRVWNGDNTTGSFGAPIDLLALTGVVEGVSFDNGYRGEAVVNLTALGILDPNDEVCKAFAGVIPATMTGNSDTADLKDLVLTDFQPNLNNCGSLKVVKTVTGGDDFGAEFPITLEGGDVDRTENLGHSDSFTEDDLFQTDTYTVSEDLTGLDGWSIDSIVCSDGASSGAGVTSLAGITVTAGETTTCTVTNTPDLPDLTVVKQVINDDGGTAFADDFTVRVNGDGVALTPADAAEASNVMTNVAPGDYTITEDDVDGYELVSITCDDADGGATATLGLGESATCTVVNDDLPASLTLVKAFGDHNGGTAVADDFRPVVNGDDTDFDWDTYEVDAGSYTIGEVDRAPATWLADGQYTIQSIDCGNQSSTVAIPNGGSATCTVTNMGVPAGLTIVKVVQNNWGGTLGSADFPLTVNGDTVTSGVAASYPAGTYDIAETQQDGYELVSTVCVSDVLGDLGVPDSETISDLVVSNAESVVCTFTNRDTPAALTLEKVIVDDDGGVATQDDFTPTLDDQNTTWGAQETTIGDQTGIAPGTYTVGELATAGWDMTDIQCDDGTSLADGESTVDVTLVAGDDVTCTITNDDQPGSITVHKVVDSQWTDTPLTQDDFPLTIDGDPADWDVSTEVDAGSHTITETQQDGYQLQSVTCTRNGDPFDVDQAESFDVTTALGDVVECTITNEDIPAEVILRKTVTTDDGGTLSQDDFPVTLDGDPAEWDTTYQIRAGDHEVAEEQQSGYVTDGWTLDCTSGDDPTVGSFTAELGESYECRIVNDDEPGTLTLRKVVRNENGGTATQDAFTPTIDAGDAVWGDNVVDAGTYTVDERDADGFSHLADGEYTLVSIECNGQLTDTVTVANGESAECVVTNLDVPAGLTIVKVVNNNWGGTLEPADFPLTINDEVVDSGELVTLPAGDYTVSEEQQDGYELTDLTCISDRTGDLEVTDATSVDVSVGLNEAVVCTFTNRDLPPSLTVLKEVVNDDGGTATEDDFTPVVDDVESTWGSQDTTIGDQTGIEVGDHTIAEIGLDGYVMTDITCTDETVLGEGEDTVTVTLGLGDDVTCTITNDDVAPTVVLRKVVVNDDGGTLTQDDFPVTFDDGDAAWDEVIVTTAGEHVAAEETQPGYIAGDWGGDCAADGSLDAEVGGTYECTITNDDAPAGLTVIKEVVNDDGGTAEPGDFTLEVTPDGGDTETVTTGTQTTVAAGTYTVGEQELAGYELTDISCDDGTELADGATTVDVTVANDASVVCTVTNDDLPIGIQVIKVADQQTVAFNPAGDPQEVTYTYTITNIGEVELTDLTLIDDVLGEIILPTDTLPVNGVILVTATHTVTAADAAAGSIVNVVVVTGTSPDGRETDDDDDEIVQVTIVEVLPDVAPPPAAPTLPATGADTQDLALWAALAAALGVLLLLLMDRVESAQARRRRR